MKGIKAAAIQFTHAPGDKAFNWGRIRSFVREAAAQGVDLIVFPEMCITGYWHVRKLSRAEVESLAESVPAGLSTQELLTLAAANNMTIGAGLIVMLGFFRLRFARWPLVPIALCVATSDALGYMWFSILIGWICKTCVMRVGGISVYNRVRPAFLGMVIGEILIAGAWMVVGAVIRMNGYELDSVRILPS